MEEEHCRDSSAPEERHISHLALREIQAPLAASLIRGYSAVLGQDRALEIAMDTIRNDAELSGAKTAEARGGNTLLELSRHICETWAQDDAIVIRDMKMSDRQLSFRVERCRYAELYDRLEITDLGYCLSCSRDAAFARGFNPRIRMTRVQTIMQGDACCDFLFTLE